MTTTFNAALQVRAPSPLEMIRTRKEAEALTDAAGADVYQRMVFPPRQRHAGEIAPDALAHLRELVGHGDLAAIFGPLECYVVLRDAPALTIIEALAEGAPR